MVSQIDLFATILDYVGLSEVAVNENAPSKSFAPYLQGGQFAGDEAEIFIEQEEVRAIRTSQWLYMGRFMGSKKYPFEDELYDLVQDPSEKTNLINNPQYAGTAKSLSARVDAFFQQHADPQYDLWHGGSTKSNSDKPWLWKDAWGEDWEPTFG